MLLSIDFDGFANDTITWLFSVYETHLGVLVWPIIFAAVIGFTYTSTKSIGSVVAVIFLTFGLFGTANVFLQSPEFSLFFSIIAAAGFAGVVLALFLKRYG